jgi:UPF0716 protein FxsA
MVLVLLVAFIVVPIVELAVIIQVAQVIHLGPTLLLLLADSIVGAWLVRREGRSAWRRFRAALDEPRIPTIEVVDGALVMLGGALMLTPGFVTDVFGLLLVIPLSRGLINRMIRARVRGRFGVPGVPGRRIGGEAGSSRTAPRPGAPVDVEVLSVERTPPRD